MNYIKPSTNNENWQMADATIDFQKRAKNFDYSSRWVRDIEINYVPYSYFSCKSSLGDILDAGGGTGYLAYYLTSKIPFSSLTIVDASINMLQQAKERIPQASIINSSIESYCINNYQKFDTILARQIFHYVNNVETVIDLLKEKLKKNGYLYVGQFVVPDKDSDEWHTEFIKKISVNRKRSFILRDFQNLFVNSGFQIIKSDTYNYEENVKDFYRRRTNDDISYDMLLQCAKETLNKNIIRDLSIRTTDDNLYFTVQFCHLLLMNSN